MTSQQTTMGALSLTTLLLLTACGGSESPEGRSGPGGGRSASAGKSDSSRPSGGPGGSWGGPGGRGEAATAAVPVESTRVESRSISSYLETNGTLEAENEVDLVARVAAPVIEILVEEGDWIRKGDLLARLDDDELAARAEASRITLEEARLAWERSKSLQDSELISPETYDAALARYETAQTAHESNRIQLSYTEIRAPFSGWVVARYVQLAQQVSVGTPIFRLSDFDPLLCPIQIPERELPRLEVGQRAYVQVEAWPGERFEASVLRIRPVVDAATGTVRVTLEMDAMEKLRPGMFARVFVEVDKREHALVIPKSALSLESLGDTVFVVEEGLARTREVELGFREGDSVEVRSGLALGEEIVSVGQDGLSDGTPVRNAGAIPTSSAGSGPPAEAAAGPGPGGFPGGGGPGMGGGRPPFDPSKMSAEELEQVKERMRSRGLSEAQIEERLGRARENGGS